MSTKNNNTHLIVLSVGDADSGDGHGKNKKFYIMTNRGSDQIAEAYEHGVNVIGVDIEELTRECDASKIDAESIAKLSRSGFDVSGIDPDFSINAKRYVQIFMHIAMCGSAVMLLQCSTSRINPELREFTTEEFLEALSAHKAWVNSHGLEGKQADLSSAYLEGCNFSGVDLSYANLNDSFLYRANFSGANLTGTLMQKTALWWANMSNSILVDTDLYRAQLWHTNMSWSVMRNTRLEESSIAWIDIENAFVENADTDNVVYSELDVQPYIWRYHDTKQKQKQTSA